MRKKKKKGREGKRPKEERKKKKKEKGNEEKSRKPSDRLHLLPRSRTPCFTFPTPVHFNPFATASTRRPSEKSFPRCISRSRHPLTHSQTEPLSSLIHSSTSTILARTGCLPYFLPQQSDLVLPRPAFLEKMFPALPATPAPPTTV